MATSLTGTYQSTGDMTQSGDITVGGNVNINIMEGTRVTYKGAEISNKYTWTMMGRTDMHYPDR